MSEIINASVQQQIMKTSDIVTTNNNNTSNNFTPTQQSAFHDYLQGKNVFITGSGGCGKSYFIQKVYQHARDNDKDIRVTSMTGCSAVLLNCNATTIHKWGSIGLAKSEDQDIYLKIIKMKKTANYINTEILIIDEVSMLNEKVFNLLDYLCKRIRKCSHKPFGGIQLIMSGDFYQLPPVCKDKNILNEKNFCFQSELWNVTFDASYIFDVNFRQKDDDNYFKLLQEIREGNISLDSIEELVKCSKKSIDDDKDGVVPTKLLPIKRVVDSINNDEIKKIDANAKRYTYMSKVQYKNTNLINKTVDKKIQAELDHFVQNSMFEEQLELCEGCQVMCITNLDQEMKLVNGSQGKIIEFVYDRENNKYYPMVKFDKIAEPIMIKEQRYILESNQDYSVLQLPIVLSWAITIHKSQGLSLDKAYIDIGNNIFECGQTYVALSRVKTLEGLYIKSINIKKIKANPIVVKFYRELRTRQNTFCLNSGE